MNPPLSLEEYFALTRRAPEKWDPDPFTNPKRDWQRDNFDRAVDGMTRILERVRDGEVTKDDLKQSDIKEATRENTYKYWLYVGHHPPSPSNEWKRLGQRYWSVDAWRSYRERGDRDLVLEHVVPKKRMWECLVADSSNVRLWMERNLCCVVTVGEDRHRIRQRQTHPNPADPWLRYSKTGIVLLYNRAWTTEQRAPLLRHGLLDGTSFAPDGESHQE